MSDSIRLRPDDLRRAFRHYQVIHVICDNAFNHRPDRSKVVRKYLEAWGERVRVHFLPKYAPEYLISASGSLVSENIAIGE